MKKPLVYLLALCIAILGAACILTAFDCINITIPSQIHFGVVINALIQGILFLANLYFVLCITLKVFNFSTVKHALCYIPIYIASCFVPPQYFALPTAILPCIYCIYIALYNKVNILDAAYRLVMFTLFTAASQLAIMYIRLNVFDMNFSGYINIVCQIDLFITYALICAVLKGEKDNVALLALWQLFVPDKAHCHRENHEGIQDRLKAATPLRRAGVILCIVLYQCIQLAALAAIAIWLHAPIEMVIAVLAFWTMRAAFVPCWHGGLTACTVVTMLGFYAIVRLSAPVSISILSCAVVASAWVYCLHKYELHKQKLHTAAKRLDIYTCTETELRKACRRAGFSESDTELSVVMFVQRAYIKGLAADMHMDTQVLRNKKTKLKKRIMDHIDDD